MGTGGIVTIEIGWPAPQLSPNSRAHFMEKYRLQRATKDTAYWATKAALGHNKFTHDGSELIVRMTAHPPKGKVRMDDDNLASATKYHRDGIALALGVDDKHFRPQAIEWADPVPHGKLIVSVGQ